MAFGQGKPSENTSKETKTVAQSRFTEWFENHEDESRLFVSQQIAPL